MYNQMGVYSEDSTPRVSKSLLRDATVAFVQSSRGVAVTKVVDVETYPDTCKHACLQGGVKELTKELYNYDGWIIPYYFCSSCGKLRVYLDLF